MFLPHLGGIEQNIYYFSKYSKMNHSVITDKLPTTKNFEKIENIDVYRVPPINHFANKSKMRLISNLIQDIPREINKIGLLKEINYDILHLRGPYLSIDLFYGLDCLFGISFFKKFAVWRNSKKPKIITFHNLHSSTKFVSKEAESNFWLLKEKSSWKNYEKFLCKQVDEIVCVDRFMIEPLKKMSQEVKIHYIPSGVDLRIFKPLKKDQAINSLPNSIQNFLKDDFKVLFLGRLDPMKGLSFLEELAKKLPSSIKIILVGEGKLEIKSPRIINLGKLDNNLVCFVIDSCDIVFQPLILEGISRVSLESLACGKPTIMLGSKLDHYPLENGKNGFVVDSVNEAVNLIIELKNSESLYKEISYNAIQTSKNFDVRLLAKKLDRVYQSMLD